MVTSCCRSRALVARPGGAPPPSFTLGKARPEEGAGGLRGIHQGRDVLEGAGVAHAKVKIRDKIWSCFKKSKASSTH